jgi:HNH endonuclease
MAHSCIFCESNGPFLTREHILPESLGGDDSFVMKRCAVCDKCQNYFGAKIEAVSLNNFSFSHWRTFGGIRTKKGKVPFFDFFEGTLFGPDTSGTMSVAFHPFFHRAVLEGRKTQLRLLAEPHDRTTVCRFLLKMAIELMHEDHVADVYHSQFRPARRFARVCSPGSQWWFMLADHDGDGLCRLEVADIGQQDFVFLISNGYTTLIVPMTENIIPGGDLNPDGGRICVYRCRA